MPAPEPEHRQGAQGDDRNLRESEHERRLPDDPERSSRTRNGSTWPPSRTICSPVVVRGFERAALRRAPDSLHHVAQVEPAYAEIDIGVAHDDEEDERPDGHGRPHRNRPGALASGRNGAR